MTTAETLAASLDAARNYTRYYFSKLKGQDLHRAFTCEGRELNTAYWLMAHVTSSENWLILRGTGGDLVKLPWARLFNVGRTPPRPDELPPIEDILAASKEVHEKALAHLRGLGDADLAQPHQAMMDLGGDGTCMEVVLHAIRHEAGHAGQLGTLCKLYGVETI